MPTNPQCHVGTDDSDYRLMPYLSHSGLRQWVSGDEPKSGRNLLVGTAFHTMVLEPAEMKSRYFTLSQDYDLRTKESQAAVAKEVESNGCKIALKPSETSMLREMYRAMKSHPVMARAIDADYPTEVVCVADLHGVPCKSKLDKPTKTLLDVKTTHCASEQEFRDSMVRYGYATQASFYQSMWAATHEGLHLPFAFLCASTREVGAAWIYKPTPMEMAYGACWVEQMLGLYRRYEMANAAESEKKGKTDER